MYQAKSVHFEKVEQKAGKEGEVELVVLEGKQVVALLKFQFPAQPASRCF